MNEYSVEVGKYVCAAVPIDTTGATVSGDWVHLKHYRRCAIIIQQGAWAGGTPAVTLNQAKTNSGGSSKTLSFTRYWKYTALTSDTPVETAVVSDTFNLAATANITTVIEVHVNDLDVANGFFYLQVAIASPGANADLISVMYRLYDPAHGIKAANSPTVIA